MRHLTSTIAVCAFVGTVGVFAQEPPAPPQPTAPAPSAATAPTTADQRPKATVTGCVMQAKTTNGGTAYVLNKAEGGSAAMYVLGGSADADWSTNVNKRVEVTGPVQEPTASTSAPDPKVLRPPLLIAETVKVVAPTCS